MNNEHFISLFLHERKKATASASKGSKENMKRSNEKVHVLTVILFYKEC